MQPFAIGCIHFIGIGGIGMSGIAEALVSQGAEVSGSDLNKSANTERLEKLGCKIHIGHKAKNIGKAEVVVISSAVKEDNLEFVEARKKQLPIVSRSEMLAELMRLKWSITVAGSHGKTTTTSLIGHILDAANYDPFVINGGIINAYNTNIRLGEGQWCVAEADESDGSFLKLPATIAVVTNMDPEHMEHYGDVETLRAAFLTFLRKVPFYGFAVMCLDHPEVQAMVSEVRDRRIITYGFSRQAMVRAVNIRTTENGMCFDVEINDATITDLHLHMFGEHNVLNALAAIGVAHGLGIDSKLVKESLVKFAGVKRRFTLIDIVDGVRIIDDYAHHPVEIAASLQGARQAVQEGRILAIIQPHRYSRLADLFDDFCACMNDADAVLVSEVYAAGEEPIEGISGKSLVAGLQAAGHRHADYLDDEKDIAKIIHDWAEAGDMVIFLGAGSVTGWAASLPAQLKGLQG